MLQVPPKSSGSPAADYETADSSVVGWVPRTVPGHSSVDIEAPVPVGREELESAGSTWAVVVRSTCSGLSTYGP